MTTPELFQALFFVADQPIGRGLPGSLDPRTQKMKTGPWRDTRKVDGMHETDDRAISPDMIARHLAGTLLQDGKEALLMPYMVDSAAMSVITAVDLDIAGKGHADLPQHFDTVANALAAVRTIFEVAAALGLRAWIETTKSGGKRLWIFHHRLPAADARDLGLLLLKRAGLHPKIEVFPKQAIASVTGNGVFLPYFGGAAPGRQVIADPATGEAMTAEEFAAAAIESRTLPDNVAAIVQAARGSGEISPTRAAEPRRDRTEGEGGERGDVSQGMWPVQLSKCAYLRGLVESAETRQELGYEDWLRLATHLKVYGGWGRKEYHRLSEFDSRYDAIETDHKFDSLDGGPWRCDETPCGKDAYIDCKLPKGKVSSTYWAYAGINMDKRAKRAASAAKSTPAPPLDIPVAIPTPAGHTDKGLPEYAPYQIAEILGIKTQAPDSDAALAFRSVQAFRGDLCHCKGLGWLHWSGARWEADDRDGSRTAALFVTLAKQVREEAAVLFRLVSEALQQGRTEDGGALERAARAHLRHVKIVESEPFAQRAMILARSPLTVDVKLFEPRAWLIGFTNGVWDKGKWHPHQREDYLLNLSPVHVQAPEDDVPPVGTGEWAALLERITGGDADYARTLQEVAGYALSGASHLRILPWAYGGKGTGKSTFAELLTAVLGDGAASIDTKLLGSDAPRERLGASLWGKRLVVCAEAGHQRIDAELLKTLSGGDSYPVRFHYQEAFTARATHVLLMTANDPPAMNAYDDALRDRVLALPCKHRLEGDDPAHPDRLIFSEGARIEEVRRNPESALVREFAAWAVSGLARVFTSQSLHKSAHVQVATAQFWKDTDTLTPFWETVDEAELRKGMTRPDLRRLYEAWCLAEGVRKPIGPQLWTQACRSAGLEEAWIGNKRGWELRGIWEISYTSYTLSPILGQSPVREKLPREGLPENTPGSVGSVGEFYPSSFPHDEDEELIV